MKIFVFIVQLLFMHTATATNIRNVFIPEVRVDDSGIVLSVLSNGCTKKVDFTILFADGTGMTITRLRADRCRAKSRLIELHYSFVELGLESH